MSARRAANKGVRAEKRIAERLGGKHVGGPGRPDAVVGERHVENKHWSGRKVHAGVIRDAQRAGIAVVNASGRRGFTKKARHLAKEAGIELQHVKPQYARRRPRTLKGWLRRLGEALF